MSLYVCVYMNACIAKYIHTVGLVLNDACIEWPPAIYGHFSLSGLIVPCLFYSQPVLRSTQPNFGYLFSQNNTWEQLYCPIFVMCTVFID